METGGIESHEAVLSANMMAMDQRMSVVLLQQDYAMPSDRYHLLRNIMLIGRPGVISGAPGFQLTVCDISLGPPK